MPRRLTPKQEAFAVAYVETGIAAEAYRRAYNAERMSSNALYAAASQLLTHPLIAIRVREIQKIAEDRALITRERWLREIGAIAFGSLDDVAPWDDKGPHLIPSKDLPREKRILIDSLKVKRKRFADSSGEEAIEWELEELQINQQAKLKALEMLGKAEGWVIDKVEHSTPAGGALEVEVVERVVIDPESARLAHQLLGRASSADGHAGGPGVPAEPQPPPAGASRPAPE